MTIHSEHPFLPPEPERNPVRRLRGRLTSGVSLWASVDDAGRRAGLTVSSMLVADGEPGRVLALLDPDADLYEVLASSGTVAVSLLTYDDRRIADAFAGVAPAPGGPFKLGAWTDTDWGPVPSTAATWAGCRLAGERSRDVGWAVLVEAVVEHVALEEERAAPLAHRRGRYLRVE